ncbi:cysteine desulfurase family protein [Crenothrix polyspora]|uniref:Cysteine desulfurase n=1 Tax=Crenothrix polyspora TaxID=360316 RepID=A0A1R4GYQ8_9GAMM|nr:cysteine desulfurase family protein [Crenothrix polyspora]SJM89126.1 Cysteine desulfurase [Crenothrix polyspora]
MIYLDYNATTPIHPKVLEAMLPFLGTFYGNPSSLYRHGRLVRSVMDTARSQVANLINAQPQQIIFTSGGTEANNLALQSVSPLGKLAISAIEHPSVSQPAAHLQHQGHALTIMDVDSSGLVTQAAIDKAIAEKSDFVSLMLANNETGAIQDVACYAQQFAATGVTVHSDAVQALGKIPVDFEQLGVQLMSLSSHKIYGPKGCGALVFAKSASITPMLLGGGQEQNYRAGTENVAAIVGFGKAAELAHTELVARSEHLSQLRDLLESALLSIPGLSIFAQHTQRLPNTVQFGIEGMDGEMLLMKLDQKGIAVSSGSACASGGNAPSPVLLAMGIEPNLAKSAIRISLGLNNTEAELVEFITVLKSLVNPA